MQMFNSATKIVPTYPNAYFLTIPPVKKYVTRWKFNIFLNFFSSKIICSKS